MPLDFTSFTKEFMSSCEIKLKNLSFSFWGIVARISLTSMFIGSSSLYSSDLAIDLTYLNNFYPTVSAFFESSSGRLYSAPALVLSFIL